MKLETSRIKGILRFKDEVSLDYRELGPGLIAFCGQNGQGKTSMLEGPIAGLLREFPSRSEKEILDYTWVSDGFIETTFEMEGVGLFRSRLSLDGPHRKSEAILARVNADGTETILNDGKLTTYDAAVREVLPPKELMLASVFSAQNRRGSFGELDRKARRQLFAALLGLEHMQTMAERGRQAAGLVQQAIEKLTAVRDVLVQQTAGVDEVLEQHAQQLQVDGGQIEARRVELQRDLAAIEQELATWQEAANAHSAARAQADRLDQDLATTHTQLTEARASLDRFSSEAETQRSVLRDATTKALMALGKRQEDTSAHVAELKGITDRLTKALADLDERIANNRKLLAEGESIREAAASLLTVTATLVAVRRELESDAAQAEELRGQQAAWKDALQSVEIAELDLARAERDAKLLGSVPCGGEAGFAGCQFLTNATAAQASIIRLAAAVSTRADIEQQLRSVEAKLVVITSDTKAHQTRVREFETERARLEATAKRQAQLDAAAERIADLVNQKEQATTDAAAQTNAAKAREVQRQHELQEQRVAREAEGIAQLAELERRLDAHKSDLLDTVDAGEFRLARFTSERQALTAILEANAAASQQVAALTALLPLRRRELDQTTEALARVSAQREGLARQRDEYLARQADLAITSARLDALHTDLVEWNLLAKALGRDGLQTLEIDEAGPTVSANANELLEASYGGRFRLRLITQEPLKSKAKDGNTMREVFELQVFDSRDGIWKDLSDLSGGERSVIDEILRSAIALLVNRRNVQVLRTLWRDESGAALDGENAQSYIRMLRKLRELGGYNQILLVTHSPECAQQCDAQVVFADGGLSIVFPPFEVAA